MDNQPTPNFSLFLHVSIPIDSLKDSLGVIGLEVHLALIMYIYILYSQKIGKHVHVIKIKCQCMS